MQITDPFTVIAAVACLVFGTAVSAADIDGAEVYAGGCIACHQAGMNGAPKYGNKLMWAPRIAQGRDVLYDHALHGLRAMPPKGGFSNLSDDEVKAAVDYIVNAAGGFK